VQELKYNEAKEGRRPQARLINSALQSTLHHNLAASTFWSEGRDWTIGEEPLVADPVGSVPRVGWDSQLATEFQE